jgi:hypothetical protein
MVSLLIKVFILLCNLTNSSITSCPNDVKVCPFKGSILRDPNNNCKFEECPSILPPFNATASYHVFRDVVVPCIYALAAIMLLGTIFFAMGNCGLPILRSSRVHALPPIDSNEFLDIENSTIDGGAVSIEDKKEPPMEEVNLS